MAFSIHTISIRRILLPWIICLFINIVAVSSDLRAQDDTLGSKTKQLLNEIRNEVDQLGNRSPNVDRAYIAAISIMNHVQRIVSPLQYSVLKTIGEDTPKTVEECLEAKAGICGNQVACFLELAKHPNIFIKISDVHNRSAEFFPFTDMHGVVKLAIDAFGIDRCLWGTGYPGHHRVDNGWLSLEDELRLVREGFDWLSDEDQSKYLGENAMRIWKWDN